MAADGGPRPVARALLLSVAVACGAGAAVLSMRETLPLPWLAAWSRAHPDPRALTAAEQALLASHLDEQRHADALLLLVAVAAGCVALALRPSLARAAGPLAAVLAAGSVALGLCAAVTSVRGQIEAARAGAWTLGDDSLDALAGPHADALRQLRARLGPGEAVLITGTNQPLFNAAAWALDGWALYPVLQDVPASLTADEVRELARGLPAGAGAPRRWLLDLGALERGETDRPALLEIPP